MAAVARTMYVGNVPSRPAYWNAANSNEWTDLASSSFTSSGVGWAGTSPGGNSTYIEVVDAWSGAVLNTVGVYYSGAFHAGMYLVLFGGGHTNYGGNELYAFGPLNSPITAPSWHRLTDPTVPGPRQSVYPSGRDGSGNPVSRHTYQSLFYDAITNKMLCMGAPGTYDGNSGGGNDIGSSDQFDFSNNTWSALANIPAGMVTLLNSQGGVDSSNRKAYITGAANSTKILEFDFSTQGYASYNINNPDYTSNSSAAVDPNKHLIVRLGTAGQILVNDMSSGTPGTVYTPTTTGSGPTVGGVFYTASYDTTRQRFIFRDSGSGKKVYFLSVPATPSSGTWIWTSTTPSGGSTPGTPVAQGVYGREVYIEALDMLLTMPNKTSAVSIYKF